MVTNHLLTRMILQIGEKTGHGLNHLEVTTGFTSSPRFFLLENVNVRWAPSSHKWTFFNGFQCKWPKNGLTGVYNLIYRSYIL